MWFFHTSSDSGWASLLYQSKVLPGQLSADLDHQSPISALINNPSDFWTSLLIDSKLGLFFGSEIRRERERNVKE